MLGEIQRFQLHRLALVHLRDRHRRGKPELRCLGHRCRHCVDHRRASPTIASVTMPLCFIPVRCHQRVPHPGVLDPKRLLLALPGVHHISEGAADVWRYHRSADGSGSPWENLAVALNE